MIISIHHGLRWELANVGGNAGVLPQGSKECKCSKCTYPLVAGTHSKKLIVSVTGKPC